MSVEISGISRSGRVRKKSAKLLEMEEVEKTDAPPRQHSNSTSFTHQSPLSNGTDQETPKKCKKLKIKFSLDDGGVEEIPIDNEIQPSDFIVQQPTVPSLKIKLFSQNSAGNYVKSSMKDKKPPRNSYEDNENAANILFQQITSGQISTTAKKRIKKKSYNDLAENSLFEPDQSSDEEASLVISDSNESLQAALEHAKAVKPPSRRLTETKFETTKSGLVKLKKVDLKSDKKQKLSKITAYTLFARENRSRIQQSYPTLDFANISRRLGEVWQALPHREKMQWKRKAQKQKGLNQVQQIKSNQTNQTPKAVQQSQSKFVRHSSAHSINNRHRNQQQEFKVNLHSKTQLLDNQQISSFIGDPQAKPTATSVIDLASHLKILGDSLNAIGNKLNNETFNEGDALDLLLDSAVCAFSPLVCLTKLIPELNGCDESTKIQLLNNVAFLMPGL